MKVESKNYFSKTVKKILEILEADIESGLSQKEANQRLEKFGKNKLKRKRERTILDMVVDQLKSPLVYILVAGVVLSSLFREWVDAGAIFIAMLASVAVGVWQEYKSSNIFEKLNQTIERTAVVIRDGKKRQVPAEILVPGDVVLLEIGRDVPADCRLITVRGLMVNEAALTGESAPVAKSTQKIAADSPLAERKNMVYMGTTVVDGSAKAVVIHTGDNTEIGKISGLIQETESQKTSLQEKMAGLAKNLSIIVLIAGMLILLVGLWEGRDIKETAITAIAVSVATVPEGLVPATSIILAISANRIYKKKGLVKRLLAAETLGSVTIICTDKTGTLTLGEMEVQEIITGSGRVIFDETGVNKKRTTLAIKDYEKLIRPLLFANEAIAEKIGKHPTRSKLIGNPTDKAVMTAGIKLTNKAEEILGEEKPMTNIQFNSNRKYLASFHDGIVYLAGASEVLLPKSKIDKKSKQTFREIENEMAEKGLRVVGLAQKKMPKNPEIINQNEKELENLVDKELDFLGLVIISDPIRDDVADSIRMARNAGILPVMATGDQLLTAKAVGRELGFDTSKEATIEGKELDKLSDKEFAKKVTDIHIYARVNPKHKIRIIKAWQGRGEIIAMTGDGVNDAPALKRANIGVAVASGTDVAKESADLILTNNSFTTITEAIKQGRIAYDNMRKAVIFLLADSFTELGLIITALLLNIPLPITGLQILWINFVKDVFPGIALGFEPGEENIMERKPVPKSIPLVGSFAKNITTVIATSGILLSLFIFIYGYFYLNLSLELMRTLVFATVGFSSLVYIFSIKNFRKPIFRINIADNIFLNQAVLLGTFLLIIAIYLPGLNDILDTVPLPAWTYLPVFLIPVVQVFAIELVKKQRSNLRN